MRWKDINQITELKMNSTTLTGSTKYPFTFGFEFEVVLPEDFEVDTDSEEYFDRWLSNHYEPDVTEENYFEDYFLIELATIVARNESGEFEKMEVSYDMVIYTEDGKPLKYNEFSIDNFFQYLKNEDSARETFDEKYRDFEFEQQQTEFSYYLNRNTDEKIDFEKLIDYFGNEIDSDVTYSSKYHGTTKSGTEWVFEPDSSINPPGVELVSPVFDSFEEANDSIFNVVQWFDNYGFYSNASTGFHVNIGTFKTEDIDLLKLMLFLGETHIINTFERQGNQYVEPMLADIADELEYQGDTSSNGIAKMNKYILGNTSHTKFFNLQHLDSKGYIEFRAIGNDYLSNLTSVMTTVKRFMLVLDIAMDKDAYKKEYLKKISKLVRDGSHKIDRAEKKSFDQTTVIKQLGDFVPRNLINSATPANTLQSMIYNGDSMGFSQWPSSLKIAVRELINSIEPQSFRGIAKTFETTKMEYPDEPFVRWIEPLLKKKQII